MFLWRIGIVVFLSATPVFGQDADQREPSGAKAKYNQLLKEFEESPRPRRFAARFLTLAKEHPQDAIAFDALAWIVKHVNYRPQTREALQLLEKNHLRSDRIAEVFPAAKNAPLGAEKLLKAVMEKHPDRAIQAKACYQLTVVLDQQASLAGQLQKQPGVLRRAQQYYGKALADYLMALDLSKTELEKEKLFERILKSYADVPTEDGAMGDIAAKALFAMRHLAVGKKAPHIEGEDIDGARFKLSDYRGKVVMISFWAHW